MEYRAAKFGPLIAIKCNAVERNAQMAPIMIFLGLLLLAVAPSYATLVTFDENGDGYLLSARLLGAAYGERTGTGGRGR